MYRVLGNVKSDLDPKAKDQIIHFPANASPLKPLDIAFSNLAGA